MSVCGGGAWEMALARQLQEHINTNKIEKFVPSQTLEQWLVFPLHYFSLPQGVSFMDCHQSSAEGEQLSSNIYTNVR